MLFRKSGGVRGLLENTSPANIFGTEAVSNRFTPAADDCQGSYGEFIYSSQQGVNIFRNKINPKHGGMHGGIEMPRGNLLWHDGHVSSKDAQAIDNIDFQYDKK